MPATAFICFILLCVMVPSTFLQVCGVTQGGGFAGEVIIKEGGVVKLPTHVDLIAAAGLPVIFGTAHLAIKERAQVKPGPLTNRCMSSICAFGVPAALPISHSCMTVCFGSGVLTDPHL